MLEDIVVPVNWAPSWLERTEMRLWFGKDRVWIAFFSTPLPSGMPSDRLFLMSVTLKCSWLALTVIWTVITASIFLASSLTFSV